MLNPLAIHKVSTPNSPVVGRFAPSPTGELHLGSLITAVASFCLAKLSGGKWLVRIEDIDTQRCRPQFSQQILHDLERLGLYWDDEVRYQSQHLDTYHAILDENLRCMTYGCSCSRKSIQHYFLKHYQDNQNIAYLPYPQICSSKNLSRDHVIRLRMPYQKMVFFDQLQGLIWGNPQAEQGDIVLRRKMENGQKGMINYMLAVVVDDALQGVNQVVRGLDILPLTMPQLVLADYLKAPLIQQFYHLPILVNEAGKKLSKQTLAQPISPYAPQQLLQLALYLLGQPPVDNNHPTIMLQQAIIQWDNRPLYRQKQKKVARIEQLLSK